MKSYSTFNCKPSLATAWSFQWVPHGETPCLDLQPGKIAGFEDYFQDAPTNIPQRFIGATGTQRFEVADWLRKQSEKLGMDQYIIEVTVELRHSFKDRINGVDAEGMAIDEYEVTKPTVALRQKLAVAWSKVIMNGATFTIEEKIDLLTAATSDDVSAFLPISSYLFSKSVENMPEAFQNARAIIFPAIPFEHQDWSGKTIKLIAFREDAIVSVKPTWTQAKICLELNVH